MRIPVKPIPVLLLALSLPIVLGACGDTTDAEFGTVSIQLTDAPGDEVVEAWVTITDIYLQGEGGEADPEGGRVYLLRDAEDSHELLSLANTVETLVSGQQVPTGTYGQLRVVITEGCIETGDNSVYSSSEDFDLCGTPTGTLRMPSFAQSGAKVNLNGLTVVGGQQVLVLDFDVEDSFGQQAGASGMWVMNPVIHAAEVGLTAAVEVTLDADQGVLPENFDLGQFSATLDAAESDSSRVAFTDDDGDGTFEVTFSFLVPTNGPFQVRLNPPEGLSVDVEPDSPQAVDPGSGETATVEWELESAEASS